MQSSKIAGQQSKQSQSNHITQCILHLSGYQKKKYTIDELYNTKCLNVLLHKMCPQYFSLDIQNKEMQNILVQYFYNEYGYFIRPILKKQDNKQKIMILVIYACIYSLCKEIFVEKIIKLPIQIQEKLVYDIESLQLQLKQLRNENKLIQTLTKLQNENSQLKSALNSLREQKQQYEVNIQDLHTQLKQTTHERNTFVLEKKKILNKFSIQNITQYQQLCIQLVQENQIYCKRQEELIQTIHNLEKQIKQLKDGLRFSDETIVTLNSTKNDFMKKCAQLKNQIKGYQQSAVKCDQKSTIKDKRFMQSATTQDQTIKKQTGSIGLTYSGHQVFNTYPSGFSIGERRNSIRNIFNETKNTILMQQKIQYYEQELYTFKLKIQQLQREINQYNNKQRFNIKKYRKIKKFNDQFIQQYSNVTIKSKKKL